MTKVNDRTRTPQATTQMGYYDTPSGATPRFVFESDFPYLCLWSLRHRRPGFHARIYSHEKGLQRIEYHGARHRPSDGNARAFLPLRHLAAPATVLPLHPHMLAICHRGPAPSRPPARLMAGHQANPQLPPMGRLGLRPRAAAPEPTKPGAGALILLSQLLQTSNQSRPSDDSHPRPS